MMITVTVKPRSSNTRVNQLDDGRYSIAVPAPPEDGRANEMVVAALADHFDVSPNAIRIVSGKTARTKRIAIEQ